jgi:NADPH:quinone reductase
VPAHSPAWVADRLGPPDAVLTLTEVPDPTPAPGEVVVSVEAAGVNFADGLLCEGRYQHRAEPPLTPGIECVGVVVAHGAEVDSDAHPHLRPGTRVVGSTVPGRGAWAHFAVARPGDLLPLRPDVDATVAAAAHVVFQTAWVALLHRARLRPGETVVVQGAGGATGGAAVQVARSVGARVVAAVSGPGKVAAARTAGPDVVVDTSVDDLAAVVTELTAGRGADVVYDPVGGATLESGRRLLGFEGRLLVIGFASGGEPPTLPANRLLVRNHDAVGVAWPAYRDHRPDLVVTAQAAIDDGLADGTFRPVIAGVRPLGEALAALDDLRSGNTAGKWVLTVG